MIRRPRGLLFDYGGTLVEEVGCDTRAATEFLLSRAIIRPTTVTLAGVLARANRITREVAARRDEHAIETPWPSLTRLIYDAFGVEFDARLEDLELPFWNISAKTRAMPGVREALEEFRAAGIRMGVVSNSSFRHDVIRAEIAKHDLAEFMMVMVASAEYAVRKPNPLLYEVAAARLGLQSDEIWFIGDRLDTDIAGARAAGMTSVWFGCSPDADPAAADVVAPTWSDVLDAYRSCAS